MSYDKKSDGNLAALEKYLMEEEEGEVAFENMMEELDELLMIDLEDLKDKFREATEKYSIDYTFASWVRDVL